MPAFPDDAAVEARAPDDAKATASAAASATHGPAHSLPASALHEDPDGATEPATAPVGAFAADLGRNFVKELCHAHVFR